MAKSELILAIDVGADSLKMAEFTYPPTGGLILEKFACSEFGSDLREEEVIGTLKEALVSAFAEHAFTAKKVLLSISGQSAFIRFVKLPPIGEEEGRVKQVVEYEAKQNVPFPIEEVVWDYQLIGSSEDETEIEVMFVVVKGDLITELTNTIEELGKEAVLVDVAPTACYNSSRANELGESECVMILNIGGRCSSLVFIDSGRFFVRNIPIAGHTVTQQISKEFGIPFGDAEELKRRHGFVALGGAYEEPDSEVAATVSKIVRNVMTRLHGEINRSINVYRSQQKGTKPTKLYLAGGSSVMAFTPRFFSEKLKIPVEYFNPFQVVSLSPNIDRESLAEVAHMFSEVIGLGLRHATICPIEISLMPESLKRQHEIKQKTPFLYASAACVVLCLVITLGAISRQEQIEKNKAKEAKNVLNRTNQKLGKVQAEVRKKGRINREYLAAKDILDERIAWFEVINELQQLLPDNMWLTKISPGKAPAETKAADGQPKKRHGGFFPMFRQGAARKTVRESTDVEWLSIEGHTLISDETTPIEEVFRQNVVASELFTDNKNEVKTEDFEAALGTTNITYFKMAVKLKNPIER